MLGRNPWPLLTTLIVVAAVRIAWSHHMPSGSHWSLFVRLAVAFGAISVVFNVLTVRTGDRSLFEIPDEIPLVGGDVTLNAAVYGLLGGLALVLLVLVGTTVAALLDWSAIIRLLPAGLTSVAVAGSVAFALLPQTAIAFREIREAQMARGHRIRGARDFLPIVVPMLGGGLERAITLSEALESRGFGASSGSRHSSSWIRYGAAIALGSGALAAYSLASGYERLTFASAGLAIVLIAPAIMVGRRAEIARTRYRASAWSHRDTATAAGAALAIGACLYTLHGSPESLRYEPYPRLDAPYIGLLLLASLLALLIPAVLAPPAVRDEEPVR
jgi:energy-coupling factor transport system permease protein